MADSSVTLTFAGNSADAERAIATLERKFSSLEQKIKALKSKKEEVANFSFAGTVASLGGMAKAYTIIVGEIQKAIDKNKELQQAGDSQKVKMSRVYADFQIQAGLSREELELAKPRIRQSAQVYGQTDIEAFKAATALIGVGVDKGKVGEATDALLEVKAATASHTDSKDLANAMGRFMNSEPGMSKDAAGIRDLGHAMHGMYKSGQIQLESFQNLAAENSNLQGISRQERMAAFSTLVDVKKDPEAATSLRQVVGRMETFAKFDKKVEALASLGLKPADVDLVGEDLQTGLFDKLGGALDKVPKEKQNVILTTLFEEEGRGAAQTLLQNRSKMQEYIASQNNGWEAYNRDVNIATSTEESVSTRLENRRLQRLEVNSKDTENRLQIGVEYGGGEGFRTERDREGARSWMAAGWSQEASINSAFDKNYLTPFLKKKGEGTAAEEINKRYEQEKSGAEEQKKLLQEQNKYLGEINAGIQKLRPQVNRQGQGEK